MDENKASINEAEVKAEMERLEAEQREDERAYFEALDKLNSYKLDWNFRSVNFAINRENTSFGQLRSCVYVLDNSQPVFDYIRSTLILIKAGLVGSGQISENDTKRLDDRAFEIIEDWRSTFGYIGTLHLLIINQMETKHFFMGTQDLRVINHLSSKNLQVDLGTNILRADLEEKTRQAQALTSVY